MGRYDENGIVFTRMQIIKKRNGNPQCVSMSAKVDVDKIKSIGISHERTWTPNGPLNETALSILRTGLVKLTRIARLDRPDLMYGVFGAAQIFLKRGNWHAV